MERIIMAKQEEQWLQKAIKREGRVRRYLRRVYGNRAFNKDGTIKMEYLDKAERRAEKSGNRSLEQAINLAKRLKKMARKKKKKASRKKSKKGKRKSRKKRGRRKKRR